MIHHPRVVAQVSLERVKRNLRRIHEVARKGHGDLRGCIPMIKSNGYGHGIVEIGRALERSPATLALGVATLDEAVQLRAAGVLGQIWVFSDCAPWDDTVQAAVTRFGLTPMIHTLEDLRRLARSKAGAPEFQLKFNTGMNRLGLAAEEATEALALVRALPRGRLVGLCTHLAAGELPNSAITRAQGRRFASIVREFSAFGVSYIHSCNTAATIGSRRLPELAEVSNVIRPGIGLFGYSDVPLAGLEPALKLRARVIAGRRLTKGAAVGYGATFRAPRGLDQAVVAIGYGDGFFRSLSGRALRLGGKKVGVLGRVSMDLTSIGTSVKAGDWVNLLGEDARQGPEMAKAAGTITYEVLTAISQRVPRVYEEW